MLIALAIRFHELSQPIVRFHATRHYRSAVLARACYYDHAGGVPEWARRVGNANREMQQAGEPPIMESLACAAYLVAGREDVMIPRAMNVAIWVLGAIPLWLLASRLASDGGAWIAVTLYLFLPYAIVASRNFQPDQLMTVASVIALLAVIRDYDRPTRANAAMVTITVALAGVIKPMSVFLTMPAVLAAATVRQAPWPARLVRAGVLTAGGLIVPMIYYGYSAAAGSLVRDQMRMRFVPDLIGTSFFWNGLAAMASRVETLPLLVLAVFAAFVASDRLTRRLLAALFAGYAMFAVAFTYHMPTHDYYHLPYIPVTALGIAALFARIRAPRWLAPALCTAIAITGSIYAWPRLEVRDAPKFARIYEAIGALTAHDTKALFLDAEYGFALMYHAQISGDSWPNLGDLAAEAYGGRPAIDAEARFERDFAAWRPSYFIVTDLKSFAASTDLQRMLDRRATPVQITDEYRVYRFTS